MLGVIIPFSQVPGDVVSDTVITFDTPNFEKYGAVAVEGRVGVGGKSLTNSVVVVIFSSVRVRYTNTALLLITVSWKMLVIS